MTTYAIDVLDNLVREELPASLTESLPSICPLYRDVITTSMGVEPGKIGRNWEIEHLFSCGVAGLIQHADPNGPAMVTNTTFPQSEIIDSSSGALAPFPTAVDSPHVSTIKRTLTLQMSTGNFSIPITWIQGDALPASQIEQVVRDIKAVGELRALSEAQSFFMNSNNTLARITAASYGTSNYTATFTIADGRIAFFRIGMMVDILAGTTATSASVPQFGTATNSTDRRNYVGGTKIPLIVSNVDYLNKTVTVATVPSTDMTTFTININASSVHDWIILANNHVASTREMRTWGLEDWIKSSGQIMGGAASAGALDLDTYGQFKSQVVAVNGPLTDTVMNGYFGGFLDAYPDVNLDTIITTQGVTLKYLEQPGLYNNRMNYDRTGKTLSVRGGWDEVSYSFGGRSFRWMISPMCMSGRFYGVKLGGGNIKRYIPPRVGGSDGRVGSEIEFLAPLGGHKGIFMVAKASTGASQALLEAPFWQYVTIAPVDVRSIKFTDLTEATMV